MTSAFGAGEQPPPRRDNGLRADQFVALADVDPRLGEHLLDLLRLADIAAYLEPSTDPRVAVRYRVSGPVERLYVHAGQRQEARAVVVAAAHEAGGSAAGSASEESAASGSPQSSRAPSSQSSQSSGSPQPSGSPQSSVSPESSRSPESFPDVLDGIDTDAEFARIVAGFTGPTAGSDAPGPTTAGSDAPGPDAAQDDGAQHEAGTHGEPGPVNRHGIDPSDLVVDPDESDRSDDAGENSAHSESSERRTRDVGAPGAVDDDDDHFHPPPAPPFPVPTANTVGAVLLLVLGMLVLLRGDLLGLDSNTSFPASIILLLTASALFIRGLRDRPEPGDEPEDDGAEV